MRSYGEGSPASKAYDDLPPAAKGPHGPKILRVVKKVFRSFGESQKIVIPPSHTHPMAREQLFLLESPEPADGGQSLATASQSLSRQLRSAVRVADVYRLDERTRQLGRAGVAAAREALRQAGRHERFRRPRRTAL